MIYDALRALLSGTCVCADVRWPQAEPRQVYGYLQMAGANCVITKGTTFEKKMSGTMEGKASGGGAIWPIAVADKGSDQGTFGATHKGQGSRDIKSHGFRSRIWLMAQDVNGL